jgi:co-chaperonin GroES (HSP10)
MKAIGKNILIKTIDEEIKTESGLLLSSDDAKNMRYRKGLVVEPGTEVLNISKGAEIYYEKNQSYTMVIGSEQVTVIHERDVVVVL